MLIEIKDVKQHEDDDFRRWFTDKRFDLIVWYSEPTAEVENIVGFQICYDKTGTERALSWRSGGGFVHEVVDDGDNPGHASMTPVLRDGGHFDQTMIDKFLEECLYIDQKMVDFLSKKLDEYRVRQTSEPIAPRNGESIFEPRFRSRKL